MRDPSVKVDPSLVSLDGLPLDHPTGVLVALNKPLGVVCSHDPDEGRRVYDLLPERWLDRMPLVTSVGRLDKDTTGLVIITDNSALVHRLISPKRHVEKVYSVVLDARVPAEAAARFADGMLLLTGESVPCAPAKLRVTGERMASVTLTEGRYHQVRRMFAALGAHVIGLHRAAFGPIRLGPAPLEDDDGRRVVELGEGEWCDLDPARFGP